MYVTGAKRKKHASVALGIRMCRDESGSEWWDASRIENWSGKPHQCKRTMMSIHREPTLIKHCRSLRRPRNDRLLTAGFHSCFTVTVYNTFAHRSRSTCTVVSNDFLFSRRYFFDGFRNSFKIIVHATTKILTGRDMRFRSFLVKTNTFFLFFFTSIRSLYEIVRPFPFLGAHILQRVQRVHTNSALRFSVIKSKIIC